MSTKNKTKVLYLDLETKPKLAWVWGIWQQNVALSQLLDDTQILCWSARWQGSDIMESDALHWHQPWRDGEMNDYDIVKSLWERIDQADVVVGHNVQKFDVRTANARFLYHGFPPPSPVQYIDTLKIARQKFILPSYKLQYISKFLGVGQKLETGGFELWDNVCRLRDTKSFNRMVEYCEQDVWLLEPVDKKIRPWAPNLTANYTLEDPDRPKCNACGSEKVRKNGYSNRKSGKVLKYKCKDCGHNMTDRTIQPLTKEQKANILRSV